MSSGNNQYKYKKLLKDTLIFALGSLGSKVILFLLVPLYTNYLSTEEYGIADLVFTFSQILIPVFSVVIYSGVLRFGLSKAEKPSNVLVCGYIILAIGSLLSLSTIPLFGLYDSISPWKIYLVAYVVIYNFSSLNLSYLKVCEKNLRYACTSLIQTLILALTNIVLLAVFDLGIQGYLLANIAAVTVSFFLSFILAKIPYHLNQGKLDKDLFRRMFLYSAPLILNDLSWWIIHSSDKIMIEKMIDAASLGIYTVATKIPSLINVLISIFSQSWGISAIKESESTNDTSFYSSIFKYQVFLCCFATILIILIIKPFMMVYVSKDFYEAWIFVPCLLGAALFSAISTFYGSIYGAVKKNVNSMITTVIGAISNIILNYVLILNIGIWGALIGTIVSQFIIAILRLFDSRRFVSFKINWFLLAANLADVIALIVLVSLGLNIYLIASLSLIFFIVLNFKTIASIFGVLLNKIRRKNAA